MIQAKPELYGYNSIYQDRSFRYLQTILSLAMLN